MHLGAFSNEQLVAVVTWNAKGDVAKLRKLATLKAWRRQGVARMLVNYCFNQMAHQSIKSCSLLATVESLMFYKSMGFEASAPDVTRGDARYFQLRKLIDPDGVAR